jgi:hypothetical protein
MLTLNLMRRSPCCPGFLLIGMPFPRTTLTVSGVTTCEMHHWRHETGSWLRQACTKAVGCR